MRRAGFEASSESRSSRLRTMRLPSAEECWAAMEAEEAAAAAARASRSRSAIVMEVGRAHCLVKRKRGFLFLFFLESIRECAMLQQYTKNCVE